MQKENIRPFNLIVNEVWKAFDTQMSGLDQKQVEARADKYGPNVLPEIKRRSILYMFLDQYRDPMIILLLAAAVISGFVGEVQDSVVIMIIVFLNSIVGFVQEYRAEKALDALRAMAAPWATVRREGDVLQVPARELVPGDVILLEAGQIVPADLRLTETIGLKLEESPLTGESVPVEKDTRPLAQKNPPIGDIRNMAFKGTTVTYGRGTGVVVAIGIATEMGKIARLLGEAESLRTPLQKRLARVGRNLAVAALAICFIVFAAGMLRGEGILLMFLTAVSLAVAAVPEALPAVVTISLALGAKKMVRQKALIRRLPAVETLGSVTYICSDKTGTLTLNRMRVERLLDNRLNEIPAERADRSQGALEGPEEDLLLAMALSNDVRLDSDGRPVGDPTEIALYEAARDLGFVKEDLNDLYPRVAEIPFSSERQAMTTIHRTPDGDYLAFTKGGFEAVARACQTIDTAVVEKRLLDLAKGGLRVLAIGLRRWPEFPQDLVPEHVEKDLEFIGLVGSMDPPRPEAGEAVYICKQAGIHPVMITGDHPLTARAIAQRVGILSDGEGGVLTGQELKSMSIDMLAEESARVQVYARVAPEQKLNLVAALQRRGEAVAMTGDGVNDAPALKQAEIGVAMGITGTDVTKEVSDMILLDDNFATIVRAVKEGRKIYDNIRKFFKYTLTSNMGEIWTIFLAPFLGLPIPLLPMHILWVNLVTDGLPGLAMTAEPAERDVMKRSPRRPDESLFAHGMWQHIIVVGLLMGGICLGILAWAISTGGHWQTMVFTVLCISQFGHALAIRSEKESFFTIGLYSNRPMLLAIIFSIGLQIATIYVPFFQNVLHTEALSPFELVVSLVAASLVFWAVEMEKWLVRRGVLVYG
jgi:Ca2+-transporting ATPase